MCFWSYPEKVEDYVPKFYKMKYILEELYVVVMWIINQLIIYIDQMNAANDNSKNALLVAQQYVRSYACKVEVLGLSLNEWVLHNQKSKGGQSS